MTSINAAEIRRALGVNAVDSTDSLLEFNIDNPGSFCNKETREHLEREHFRKSYIVHSQKKYAH